MIKILYSFVNQCFIFPSPPVNFFVKKKNKQNNSRQLSENILKFVIFLERLIEEVVEGEEAKVGVELEVVEVLW